MEDREWNISEHLVEFLATKEKITTGTIPYY